MQRAVGERGRPKQTLERVSRPQDARIGGKFFLTIPGGCKISDIDDNRNLTDTQAMRKMARWLTTCADYVDQQLTSKRE